MFGKSLEMDLHPLGRPRIEGIMLIEHLLPGGLLHELDHPALPAESHLEIEEVFCGELLRAQKSVGNRHPTEGDKWFDGRIAY